jgi:hypothetical protein
VEGIVPHINTKIIQKLENFAGFIVCEINADEQLYLATRLTRHSGDTDSNLLLDVNNKNST